MKHIILSLSILLATTSVLWADAITFEASVNNSRISLDEVLQLTLTVTGVSDNLDPVSLPVMDGFTAKYLGPSTNISFVNINGKSESHSEQSFIYNLFPNKVGRFQVPTISATIAGQTYTTKPIDVEVFQSSTDAQAAGGASDQDQTSGAQSFKDKILLTASVDTTDVYLNERVPLTIKLLYAVPIRDIQYPQFDKTGILVDDFQKPTQGTELINGVRYDGVEFKTNIYPSRLGDLTFGPAAIQCNMLYKTGQDNPFNQDNSAFGADIFSGIFDSYTTRPDTATSQPIHLHVLPLPEAGRPQDFSGAIGQFDFSASLSPAQVKAGDPLTLKMDIKGSGNFKNFKMPIFQASGFKSYAPQIKDTGDEKTAEEVIIPTSTEIKEVPALRFSYFDTSIKDYKTITRGPFAIQVTAPSPDQEFKAVGFSNLSALPSTMPADQFSFEKLLDQIFQVLVKLYRSILFWISLGVIFVAWISYFLWKRFQVRLENDPAFARRLKAVREARRALTPAKEYISTGKVKDFYALLSKVLRDYLANKWHQSSAALSVEEIINHLKTTKLDGDHMGQIKTILEQCDLVCFAGADRDAAQMQVDLSQTQDLVTHLEKTL